MAAQQGIKRRIKSVSNTKQITKAMQLVAASKLRRSQEQALGPRAYIEAAQDMLSSLATIAEIKDYPLFQSRPIKKAVLSIAMTSDRGLAGAYNSNVNKALSTLAHENKVQNQVITIGKYATQHVNRLDNLIGIAAYDMDCADPDVMLAQPVLKEAIDLFLSGEVDLVSIVYTQYVSTIVQKVVVEQLLPIKPASHIITSRTFEPSPDVLMDLTVKRLLEAQVLQAVLESRASEQACRMLAMKNATENAEELIEDLSLAYNNARQAAITQELAEITAGAEAING